MKYILTLILSLSMLAGAAYAEPNSPSPLTEKQATLYLHQGKPVYSCPMKMEWLSDKPGQCPCCAMDLVKVKDIKDGKAVLDTDSQSMPMNMMEKK